jgi:uncharacterized protein (DUF1330 family)
VQFARANRGEIVYENEPQTGAGVLASVSIGVAAGRAIHAQQGKAAPTYLISEADAITDLSAIKKYGEKVPQTLALFDRHYHFVVAGGKAQSLDGEAPQGIVVIAFDSVEQARAWYDSPAYQAIKPIRQSAVKGRMFLVEGVVPQRPKPNDQPCSKENLRD